MSEADHQGINEASAQLALPPWQADWLLTTLVNWVNNLKFEVSITLYMKGSVISGRLISSDDFIVGFVRSLSTDVSEGEDGEARQQLTKLFTGDVETLDGQNSPPPNYIHLRNARVFTPGQRPIPQNGVLWRGRISEVDGFSIGELVVG